MEKHWGYKVNLKVTHRKISLKIGDSKIILTKDFFEKREWPKNQLVCGLDEVGRGCLAGPLVVASVILHPHNKLKLLKDSKILTKNELLNVYSRIIKNSWFSFGIVNNLDIDKFNIWNATLIAMRKSIMNLFSICPQLPSVILIDAMPVSLFNSNYENIEIYNFPNGENFSRSIAAASIIAKVKRDSLMSMYDNHLPGYNFNRHKGYATKEHRKYLYQNGKSILHRESFLNNFNNQLNENHQINIFNDKIVTEDNIY